MKRLVITSLLATGLLGAQAQAEIYTDSARVRSVDPQYESVQVPRNECRNEWVVEEHQERRVNYGPGGAIIGALAGGVLGNQVGRGSGRDAATAVGMVLGAVAGDQLQNQGRRDGYDNAPRLSQREVQRCRTVYDTQKRITGYQVAYDYHGQQYTTLLRNHPGRELQVRVSVDPIER